MSYVEHVNLVGEHGNVYCCLRNKIVKLSDEQLERFCSVCKMNRGFTPGVSVQCYWKDTRPIDNPHIVRDPRIEFSRMQARKTHASGRF